MILQKKRIYQFENGVFCPMKKKPRYYRWVHKNRYKTKRYFTEVNGYYVLMRENKDDLEYSKNSRYSTEEYELVEIPTTFLAMASYLQKMNIHEDYILRRLCERGIEIDSQNFIYTGNYI